MLSIRVKSNDSKLVAAGRPVTDLQSTAACSAVVCVQVLQCAQMQGLIVHNVVAG
jgi:hypothetical protein